jgi:hypothetical protein
MNIFNIFNVFSKSNNIDISKPITRKELIDLIRSGKDVTQVDTSEITDMNNLFYKSEVTLLTSHLDIS